MFSNQFLIGSFLITICVVFHVVALLGLSQILERLSLICNGRLFIKKFSILVFSVLFIIAIHSLEIFFWAFTFVQLGEFDNFNTAIYFSTVTSTTLGYGDIVLSEKAQLLSSFEAMGGLILFGLSTAFFIRLVSIVFETDQN
ncbi:ion channel [Marinicella sp. W31]|uniref:ion channel n=1 Tax=Marinicella sp. W31 TaxID=3023713 RepID=UPI0037584AE7